MSVVDVDVDVDVVRLGCMNGACCKRLQQGKRGDPAAFVPGTGPSSSRALSRCGSRAADDQLGRENNVTGRFDAPLGVLDQ